MSRKKSALGVALIEGLVSILVLSLGILAISKLNSHLMSSAGLTKSKAEAIQIAQSKIEELRTRILQASFTSITSGEGTINGKNAAFAVAWNVSTPDAAIPLKTLTVSVNWTPPSSSVAGVVKEESVSISTILNWTNPKLLSHLQDGIPPYSNRLKPPIGIAKRPATPINRGPGQPGVYKDGDNTELRDADGNVLLVLEPDDQGVARDFATISGRVYFDLNNLKNSFNPADVFITTTAEGHCFPSTSSSISTQLSTSSDYSTLKYYDYTCYVGQGWYANVAIQNMASTEVNVCVGDPGFAATTTMNYWTTLPIAQPASRRVYRGYKSKEGSPTGYFITGIEDGGEYPSDGMPHPSNFGHYGNSNTDYFSHHFLITDLSGQASCQTVMSAFGQTFVKNAGAALCLSPDDDNAEDKCPKVWPGWPQFIGAGAGDFGSGDTSGDTGDGGTEEATTCSGTITGTAASASVTISVGTTTCSIGGTKIKNYICGVNATAGSTVTVTQDDKGTITTKAVESFECNAIHTINFAQ